MCCGCAIVVGQVWIVGQKLKDALDQSVGMGFQFVKGKDKNLLTIQELKPVAKVLVIKGFGFVVFKERAKTPFDVLAKRQCLVGGVVVDIVLGPRELVHDSYLMIEPRYFSLHWFSQAKDDFDGTK